MTDDTIDLDGRRGLAAQKATELRRRLHEVEADQAALRERQAEFESFLAMAPATTVGEALDKACYLIRLYAATAEAQTPRRQSLVAAVLDDLVRFGGHAESGAKPAPEKS